MASRLSQRWFALLAVLFTGRIVAGRRIRINDSTATKTVLLSFGRPERTNYSLIFSPGSRLLQTLLNIDPDTGVITLTRRLKCGHIYNRTCVVAVRCISIGVPALIFMSPIVVLLNNRRCVERRMNSPSDTTLTTGRLIHSSLGTTNMNENRIALERKRLNGFASSGMELPRRLFGRNRREAKEYARTFRYLFGVTSPAVMDSHKFQKSLKMNFDTFDEARLRNRRSTRNNPPTFAKSLYRVSVRENVKVGTVVYTVSASDTDRQSRGKVDYKITAMGNINSEHFFKVNTSTGKIRTAKELDRETMASHKFRVTATDRGTPPLHADMTLTIEVLDINDHSPVFDQKVYGENISESVDIGSTVLAVRAYDADIGLNKEIYYSIVNNTRTNNVFSIGRDSGIISVEQELDREQVASYRLVVKAEDQGNPARSSTAEVYITLIDENDCIPKFNQSGYDFNVSEDSRAGTIVGVTNATDCDTGLNKKIKYSITSGNQDQAFRIESSSGIIRVQGPLDFENVELYVLQVSAEDSGEIQQDNMVSVVITVKDVNDCLPEFLKNEYRFKVKENVGVNYQLGMVQAQDGDSGQNGEIRYFLKDRNIPFKVESSSGKLRTKVKLDREKVPDYDFEVIAEDKGDPPLNSTVTVFITIEDVNDSPPYFTKVKYNATIAEDFSSSQVFLTVLAKDLDEDGSITYSVSNVPDNCFSINRHSGGLRRSRACRLNFKIKRKYVFQVGASDGQQRSSAEVVVMISDANDNYPKFTQSTFFASVHENQPAGTSVLWVNASDDDFGENARLSYDVRDVKIRKVFTIDSITGIISTLVPLNRETTPNYKFRVIATDHGTRQKSGRAWVRITVNDLNDNAPKFDHILYNVSLREDVHVGTLVYKLQATDEDDGKNNKITYSLDKKDPTETSCEKCNSKAFGESQTHMTCSQQMTHSQQQQLVTGMILIEVLGVVFFGSGLYWVLENVYTRKESFPLFSYTIVLF